MRGNTANRLEIIDPSFRYGEDTESVVAINGFKRDIYVYEYRTEINCCSSCFQKEYASQIVGLFARIEEIISLIDHTILISPLIFATIIFYDRR